MATLPFFNDNAGRTYPFVENGLLEMVYSGGGDLVLPDSAVVDFTGILGVLTDYDDTTDTVYLYEVRRDGTTFYFEFRFTASSLADYSLTFCRDLASEEFAVQHVIVTEPDLGEGLDTPCDAVIVEGWLTTGPLQDLADLLGDGEYLRRADGEVYVEPARIQSLRYSFVNTIGLANAPRNIADDPCESDDGSEDTAFIVNSRCITGLTRWKEGYNCVITQDNDNNAITIGAGVGNGAGTPCEEVPLYASEVPPEGSKLLTGGPACDEVIKTINGMPGPRILAVGGPGVTVGQAIDDPHTVVVDLNMNGLAICPDREDSACLISISAEEEEEFCTSECPPTECYMIDGYFDGMLESCILCQCTCAGADCYVIEAYFDGMLGQCTSCISSSVAPVTCFTMAPALSGTVAEGTLGGESEMPDALDDPLDAFDGDVSYLELDPGEEHRVRFYQQIAFPTYTTIHSITANFVARSLGGAGSLELTWHTEAGDQTYDAFAIGSVYGQGALPITTHPVSVDPIAAADFQIGSGTLIYELGFVNTGATPVRITQTDCEICYEGYPADDPPVDPPTQPPGEPLPSLPWVPGGGPPGSEESIAGDIPIDTTACDDRDVGLTDGSTHTVVGDVSYCFEGSNGDTATLSIEGNSFIVTYYSATVLSIYDPIQDVTTLMVSGSRITITTGLVDEYKLTYDGQGSHLFHIVVNSTLSDDLVALWHMDNDGVGDDEADESGNGHDLIFPTGHSSVLGGLPTPVVWDRYTTYADDFTAYYGTIDPLPFSLRPDGGAGVGAHTYSLWWKRSGTGNAAQYIMSNYVTGPDIIQMFGYGAIQSASGTQRPENRLTTGNGFWFAEQDQWPSSATHLRWWNTDNTWDDDDWHHIVLTRDGTGWYRLYVDGVEEAVTAVTTTGTGPTPVAGGFYVGEIPPFITGNGNISEMRIYHRELTDDEIETLAGI